MNFLLDQFELLTRTPETASKLKELILQLAVQGKLVPQNPADEPASVLLKRIRAEKEQLVRAEKIKREKPLPPITEDELPFELPEGWVWCRLGDVCKNIHYGYTASADSTKSDVRLLRITDIQDNKVNWLLVPGCDITQEDVARYKLEHNDILIARTGGTIGKSYLVRDISVTAVFASYLIRAIPMKIIMAEYVKLFIETPLYWSQLYEKSMGTGQPNVNATSLKNLYFPLPPFEAQQGVVARVESLLKQVDELVEQTKQAETIRVKTGKALLSRLDGTQSAQELTENWKLIADNFDSIFTDPDTIKGLRQSCLQLAVRGKLVPQNPADEPASVLLERIRAEKERLVRAGKLKREKPLPLIAEDEIPYELPEGWVWCRLGEVIYNFGQKTPDKTFTYIDVGSINKEVGYISDAVQIMEPSQAPSRARKIVKPGCVIYSTVRPYLLNIAVVDRHFEQEPIVSTAFAVMQPYTGLNEHYLFYYLRSQAFINYVESQMVGLAYPAINDEKLMRGLIPVPPFDEQERINKKVSYMMQVCNELETKLRYSQQVVSKIMKAALQEAFGGQVTASETGTEIQEELLESVPE